MILRNIAILFSLIVPQSIIQKKISELLRYAGSRDDERIWIGTRILLSFLIGLIFSLVPFSIFPLINIAFQTEFFVPANQLPAAMFFAFLIGFTFSMSIFYLHLLYVIDGRKKMVENIMPDFLYLVGNNLKSGMTPFYAFRQAVRPEFGPLSEEIKIAAKKSLGVGSFADALKEIANKIDSKILKDTTKFFSQALRSGGRLAELIETSANDIKQTNKLKRELVTATKMYVMFIVFIVVVASPILLAVSVQFLHILEDIQTQAIFGGNIGGASSQIGQGGFGGSAGQIGFGGGNIGISANFMIMMGYILIITNSFLASIFIGVIGGGKVIHGLKFTPLLLIGGFVVFTIVMGAVGGLIGIN